MSNTDATNTKSSSNAEKSPKDTFDELKQMVTAYAKQETVDPLKLLGQWLAFGVAGGIAIAIGLLLLGLGALRALQTQTGDWFDGSLTWIPYLVMFFAFVILIALTVRAMLKRPDFGD